jgi:hypothetical protein
MFLPRQQNAYQNRDVKIVNNLKIFWNDSNKSKFNSGGN